MVGMVISGQYFGWNVGIDVNSTTSYIYAVLLLVIFFSIFIFGCAILTHYFMDKDKSITELVGEVLGARVGFFIGALCYLEYWFATPAIAIAFAIYIRDFLPFLSHTVAIFISFAIVFFANIGNLKSVAKIETIATIIAIIGVICFYYVGFSELSSVTNDVKMQNAMTLSGFGKSVSFAIWLFLGIEGGITLMHAMKNPSKDGQKAIILGLCILAGLAILTSVFFIKLAPSNLLLDPDPLPSFAMNFGYVYVHYILLFTGLVGIMASFNGLTIGYIQQHKMLAKNYGFRNSKLATICLPLVIALVCSLFNDISQGFVILSVSCAIIVYALVWISIIKLSFSLKKYKTFIFYSVTFLLMIFVAGCTYYYGALAVGINIFGYEILSAYLFVIILIAVALLSLVLFKKTN